MTQLRTNVLLLAALAVGCAGGPLEPGPQARPGVISFYDQPVVATAPDTALAGTPFTVRVRTYGGGCLSEGETDVVVTGSEALVQPLDIHSGAEVCTDELRTFDHEATVVVAEVGTARIIFRGAEQPGDAPFSVVREVVVR